MRAVHHISTQRQILESPERCVINAVEELVIRFKTAGPFIIRIDHVARNILHFRQIIQPIHINPPPGRIVEPMLKSPLSRIPENIGGCQEKRILFIRPLRPTHIDPLPGRSLHLETKPPRIIAAHIDLHQPRIKPLHAHRFQCSDQPIAFHTISRNLYARRIHLDRFPA